MAFKWESGNNGSNNISPFLRTPSGTVIIKYLHVKI